MDAVIYYLERISFQKCRKQQIHLIHTLSQCHNWLSRRVPVSSSKPLSFMASNRSERRSIDVSINYDQYFWLFRLDRAGDRDVESHVWIAYIIGDHPCDVWLLCFNGGSICRMARPRAHYSLWYSSLSHTIGWQTSNCFLMHIKMHLRWRESLLSLDCKWQMTSDDHIFAIKLFQRKMSVVFMVELFHEKNYTMLSSKCFDLFFQKQFMQKVLKHW